jgi:hypothetical protein
MVHNLADRNTDESGGTPTMKIGLNLGQETDLTGPAAQDRALERDILAAKKGDWAARQNLLRTFGPLIEALAAKRTTDHDRRAAYIKAGRDSITKVVRRHKPTAGPHHFRIAVADCIESSMDRLDKGSFLARLFGR